MAYITKRTMTMKGQQLTILMTPSMLKTESSPTSRMTNWTVQGSR